MRDVRVFLQHCRNVGVVKDESYPDSVQQWSQQLRKHRAIDFVESIGSRPMLILHGTNDRQVPPDDARQLASLHPNPELRLVNGADHRIRHDPRLLEEIEDTRPAARRRSVAERVTRDTRPRVASCVVVPDGCWVFDVVTSPDSVCLSVCLSCLVKR